MSTSKLVFRLKYSDIPLRYVDDAYVFVCELGNPLRYIVDLNGYGGVILYYNKDSVVLYALGRYINHYCAYKYDGGDISMAIESLRD